MKDKKILIVGGDGLLGRSLAAVLRHDNKVTVTTRHRYSSTDTLFLDLNDNASIMNISGDFDIVFLCAAVTSTDFCMRNPETSKAVNVDALVNISSIFRRVVFFSSNYVFDGKTKFPSVNTVLEPATEYGRQKADAERKILALNEKHFIIRLSKVIHPEYPLFLKWIDELKKGHKISPFYDLFFSPISLQFVINTVLNILNTDLGGIWHISADGDISYAEAAYYICDKIGANKVLIEPLSVIDSGLFFENIPIHTALNMTETEKISTAAPSPFQALDEFLLKLNK